MLRGLPCVVACKTMLRPLGSLTPPLGRLAVANVPLVFVGAFASLDVCTGPTTAFPCMAETSLTILLRPRAVLGYVPRPLTIVAHVFLLGAVCRHMSWLPTSVTTGFSDVVDRLDLSF